MATLHIEHAITDLTTWQAAFDRFAEHRTAAGVVAHRITQPVDDDHYVVLQLDFTSTDRAVAFRGFLETQVWSTPANSPGLAGSPRAVVLAAVDRETERKDRLRLRRRVDLRLVAGAEGRDGARWREHLRDPVRGTSAARAVAIGGPWHHCVIDDDRGEVVVDDERARRQVGPAHLVQPAPVRAADDALSVELTIELLGAEQSLTCPGGHRGAEGVVVDAATQGAGSVSGRERDRLVVEEEDREVVWLPLRQAPVPELEGAGDPEVARVVADDLTLCVQDAAVAEPGTTQGNRDDVTRWCDAVASRCAAHEPHRRPCH